MNTARRCMVRDLVLERRPEFIARGYKERHFFPHRVVRLRKNGPDGYRLARAMCGPASLDQQWELVLYTLPPVLDEFPAGVFFDDDVVWHQQQFGLPGHVAVANLVEKRPDLYVTVLVSDIVQRISRRRDLKTRVEKRFDGWSRMLVHAALDFAIDRGFDRLHVATADWALAHTDRSRSVQHPIFHRMYDHSVGAPFVAARNQHWWDLDVDANRGCVVRPRIRMLPLSDEPEICVCHDIERGRGHTLVDPELAAGAEAEGAAYLDRMLEVEAAAGVRATYSIVGTLMPEVRPKVTAGGHCIAFHSYDHPTASESDDGSGQLERCRDIDYRIKGYRPPQSHLTADLNAENLAFHNFEWLASSRSSLSQKAPQLGQTIVTIPILFDDFELYQGRAYDDWEREWLRKLSSTPCTVLSLHDCYGAQWLPRYETLLRSLKALGEIRTLDQVAADVTLSQAE
jgi:hypothetical protein